MATKATIYKVALQVSNMDAEQYGDYNLTIACHPSENEERMMVRVLAFAMFANDELKFTQGLCDDEEPELWEKNMVDEIMLWIDLGQVDESRIKKACSRSKQAVVYTYQPRSADVWWDKIQNKLSRYNNLSIFSITEEETRSLGDLCKRTMQLFCMIQDGHIYLSNDLKTVEVCPSIRINAE